MASFEENSYVHWIIILDVNCELGFRFRFWDCWNFCHDSCLVDMFPSPACILVYMNDGIMFLSFAERWMKGTPEGCQSIRCNIYVGKLVSGICVIASLCTVFLINLFIKKGRKMHEQIWLQAEHTQCRNHRLKKCSYRCAAIVVWDGAVSDVVLCVFLLYFISYLLGKTCSGFCCGTVHW